MASLITCGSWLVSFHISSQWDCCSTFKYSASVCCSSALQKHFLLPQLHLYRSATGWFHICYIWGYSVPPLPICRVRSLLRAPTPRGHHPICSKKKNNVTRHLECAPAPTRASSLQKLRQMIIIDGQLCLWKDIRNPPPRKNKKINKLKDENEACASLSRNVTFIILFLGVEVNNVF